MTIFRNVLTRLTRLIRQVAGNDPPPAMAMAAHHREVIVQFARGDLSLKHDAVAIHRFYTPVLGVRSTTELCFMAEVDNPSPDLGLRHHYRELLLGREAA